MTWASQESQSFSLLTNWMIRLLLLGGNINPNPGSQTHKWVGDICLKPITKHQTSIFCNYTKHWVHLKCSQITTKNYNNSWYCTLRSTFNHRTQMNTTSHQKTFSKFCNLILEVPRGHFWLLFVKLFLLMCATCYFVSYLF